MSFLGREAISVNQPPGSGTNYPFVSPSPNVRQLLGDLYLGYDDRYCMFDVPLRVAWVYGFDRLNFCGTLSTEDGDALTTEDDLDLVLECPYDDEDPVPGGGIGSHDPILGYPTPTHDFDILIVDADGKTVFDSTEATFYRTVEWGDRLLVIEWQTDDAVCVVTAYTSWDSEEIPTAFPAYLVPGDGTLDSSTCERMPNRVKSLRVGLDTAVGNIRFNAGFNIALAGAAVDRTDGEAYVDAIDLDAVPGAGLGRAPGCAEVVPAVRTINQITADASGNFAIQLDDCLREQAAITMVSSPDGPDAQYGLPGLGADAARGTVVLHDNCPPCRPCSAYVRTYAGISRMWQRWTTLAAEAESVRDTLAATITAWNSQSVAAATTSSLTLVAQPEGSSNIFVAARLCNLTHKCATPVVTQFSLTKFVNGGAVDWDGAIKLSDSTLTNQDTESVLPSSSGNIIYTFTTDSLPPGTCVTIRMRICVPVPLDGEGNPEPTSVSIHLAAITPATLPTPTPRNGAVPVDASPTSYPCGC